MGQPPVNEWADMMPQTVQIAPWVSYAGGGAGATYGSDVPYQCRIEMANHLVVGMQDKLVTSIGWVFLMTTTIIGIKDRLTLPVGYTPTKPPILHVDIVDDDTGVHHVTLHLGKGV